MNDDFSRLGFGSPLMVPGFPSILPSSGQEEEDSMTVVPGRLGPMVRYQQ